MNNELHEIIEYYRSQNAAKDQSTLGELLREAQTLCGGTLNEEILSIVCQQLDLKRSYLTAVMRCIPDLKTESVRHTLTVCGGGNCRSNNSAALHSHIEKTYGAKNGQVSKKGAFSYKIGGCMKHCKEGPCINWDGQIYTKMTPERFDKLTGLK